MLNSELGNAATPSTMTLHSKPWPTPADVTHSICVFGTLTTQRLAGTLAPCGIAYRALTSAAGSPLA